MSIDPVQPSSGALRPPRRVRGMALGIDEGWLATAEGRRFRLHAVIIILLAGLPIAALLAGAIVRPGFAAAALSLALALMALAVAAVLTLRLRALRRAASERLEALQDAVWEQHDRQRADASAEAARHELAALPIATVSHEMRAPLHGMLGLADLLAETPLSAEQLTYVRALHDSGAALARLVEDLLDASRIAAGRFALEPAPIDIEPLIEQIAELLAPRAHAKRIGLATRATEGLPRVLVDEVRLRQILINLLSNAIAFTERGAVVLAVEAAGPPVNQSVTLAFTVSDSGPGVAPTDRARIFGDFERASTMRGGAGLGLAISRRIVERMGGLLTLDSRPGGGSIFGFALDLPIIEWSTEQPTAERLPGRSMLIIAEPSLELDATASLLEAAEARIARAADIASAVRRLETARAANQAFDAVLLDARIAGDRRATVEALREAAGFAVPIIILIEPAARGQVDQMRGEGLDAYLIRPIRRASLMRIVAETIDSRDAFHADPLDRARIHADRPHEGRPLAVLLAEDDPVNALLMRALLERLGHAVTTASNAAAAHAAVAQSNFDLVLADIHLEADDGIALIRSLRQDHDQLPRLTIAGMSAAAEGAIRDAALAAGADFFLEKPVSPAFLRQAVDEAIRRRDVTESLRHQTV
ncbi:response regulator [Kaistia dalseonensis]|uniref:histidine kinase n=1 Tax=Kaistia dalseonensis TaxID=410840 RepID=A0ABU0H560_9HYPH|nr:response regulator [Kaistia dalseonensis]MCX5494865.1 response regulator [Kaistia dalseonensis]MDQ0437446.1 signal transduction histidine kinase/CheY-like chemotaxis protein [Kaistia dalseonensis]